MNEKLVYLIVADTDGTLHSKMLSIGMALDSKQQAIEYVSKHKYHDYEEIKVFSLANDVHAALEERNKAQPMPGHAFLVFDKQIGALSIEYPETGQSLGVGSKG